MLAKNADGYWQRATIVELNGDEIQIMWKQNDDAVSKSLEEIWPLGKSFSTFFLCRHKIQAYTCHVLLKLKF